MLSDTLDMIHQNYDHGEPSGGEAGEFKSFLKLPMKTGEMK